MPISLTLLDLQDIFGLKNAIQKHNHHLYIGLDHLNEEKIIVAVKDATYTRLAGIQTLTNPRCSALTNWAYSKPTGSSSLNWFVIYEGNWWRRIKNKFIHSSFNNYFFFQIKSWCKEEMEKAERDQATELNNLIQTHLEKCGFWMKASPTKMDYINCHVFFRKNR